MLFWPGGHNRQGGTREGASHAAVVNRYSNAGTTLLSGAIPLSGLSWPPAPLSSSMAKDQSPTPKGCKDKTAAYSPN